MAGRAVIRPFAALAGGLVCGGGLAAGMLAAQDLAEAIPEAAGCLDVIGNQITNICTREVAAFYCYDAPVTTRLTCPGNPGSQGIFWRETLEPGGFLDVPVPAGTDSIRFRYFSCEVAATNLLPLVQDPALLGCARVR